MSDILRGKPEIMRHLNAAKKNNDNLFVPSIVYYEVVRGLKAAGKTRRLLAFQILYDNSEHLSLDMGAIEKAVEIYLQLHKGQMIEDNDIYIASIAMANDCTLVTANIRHLL